MGLEHPNPQTHGGVGGRFLVQITTGKEALCRAEGEDGTWRSVAEHGGRKRVRSLLENRLRSAASFKRPVDKNPQ